MGLIDWGINRISNADADLAKLGRVMGFVPISWRQVVSMRPDRDGVMWRIPDPAVQQVSILKNIMAVLVTVQEQVMVLRDGMAGEQILLPPGVYDLRKTNMLKGQIEVIWFTTQDISLPWGVPDALTNDGASVGASGMYKVRIADPFQFLTRLARNEQVYTEDKLDEACGGPVAQAIQNLIADINLMDFYKAHPKLENACYEYLANPVRFPQWGLEFRGLTIDNRRISDEDRRGMKEIGGLATKVSVAEADKALLLADKARQIELAEADQSILLAQRKMQAEQFNIMIEAQRQQMLNSVDAQRIQMLGGAEAEVMRNQMGIGLDPLELQRIEAIQKLAENPSQGTLIDNRPQILSQLIPQQPVIQPMMVAPMLPPVPSPVQPQNLITPPPAPVAPSSGEMTREKIEEMLDKLDDRFANGEISEQVYLSLQDKWQKRLAKLP
jgi:hypothetical protein